MKRASLFFILVIAAVQLSLSGCARAPRVQPGAYAIRPAGSGTHLVKSGETLYRISKMYGLDTAELMRVNNIESPRQLSAGQTLIIPRQAVSTPIVTPGLDAGMVQDVRRLVGPKSYRYSWTTITIHHSGTLQGGARAFDKDHRRRKMGGLFYHFVIGNGTSTPDGLIEVGWRWLRQTKSNRPNDINICIVGNFDEQQLSRKQMDSLVALVGVLKEQYGIPVSKIRKHNDIPGKHTDCPGTRFPYSEFLARLAQD